MLPSDREWLEAWCKARLERMRGSRDLLGERLRHSLEPIVRHPEPPEEQGGFGPEG